MARCTAIRYETKGQCKANAIRGGNVCVKHGGRAPQVKAKAAVRHAVATWTDEMAVADPGETLLRLMTVSLMMRDAHAGELQRVVDKNGWTQAFVGETWVVETSDDGTERSRKAGEYAKQLARWEHDERRLAADLAVKAVAAGLAERQVRVLEQQVAQVSEALQAAVVAAGLNPEQQAEVITGVARHLRLVSGEQARSAD